MQSNYLCVVLLVKRKKLLIVTVFTWFPVLEKMQDGYHVWWRYRPLAEPPRIKYTSSCRELRSSQRLSTEGKIEIRGRSINPNPPPPLGPLYHGEGMTLHVRPRVKPAYNSEWREIRYLLIFMLIFKAPVTVPSSVGRGFPCNYLAPFTKIKFRFKQSMLYNPGGGGTAIFGLYRNVLLWRAWFSSSLL